MDPNSLIHQIDPNLLILLEQHVKRLKSTSPCVDSILKELTEESDLGSEPEWTPIRVGLGFVKTFLAVIPKWSEADEVVREFLGDLVSSIEDAFWEAGQDIGNTIKKGEAAHLDAVRSNLLEKIEYFKPRIRESYDFLSEYAFRTTHSPPITDNVVWHGLYFCLRNNKDYLHDVSRLGNPLYMEFSDILEGLRFFMAKSGTLSLILEVLSSV